jgi:hypothetical protein
MKYDAPRILYMLKQYDNLIILMYCQYVSFSSMSQNNMVIETDY